MCTLHSLHTPGMYCQQWLNTANTYYTVTWTQRQMSENTIKTDLLEKPVKSSTGIFTQDYVLLTNVQKIFLLFFHDEVDIKGAFRVT